MSDVLDRLSVCETIPGWSGLSLCSRLYQFAKEAEPDGLNVEIGCYFGRTSVAIAMGLGDRGKGDRLVCIDPFENPPGETDLQKHRAQWEPPYEDRWMEFVTGAGVTNVDLIVAKSTDPSAKAAINGPVRFAFIDGDHQDPTVSHDCEWVMEYAVPGTIIAVDDYGCNQPKWAVAEAAARFIAPRSEQILFEGSGDNCAFFRVVK